MLESSFRLRRIRPLAMGVALILALIIEVQPAQAQLYRGSISGTVTDQQDAVVVGAEVTLTSQDTNIPHKATTNEIGYYSFAALDPGTYTVDFKKSGFQTKTVKNIPVNTSQEVTINPGLSVSGASTTFDVLDLPGATVSKTSPTIQMTLAGSVLDEIPMAATRDFSKFPILAPGVNRGPGQSGGFATSGQRTRNTNFNVDGVLNNDSVVTLPSALIPPEDIKEFQVQTVNFSAEFGRNTGAQVNVITKSGTNAFHGEAWDFYEGNALEPLSLASRRAGIKKCSAVAKGLECGTPMFANNQFGADVGGPIIRNKTFFFGMVQANLQRSAPSAITSSTATIPTPAGYATLLTVPLRAGQTQASRDVMLKTISFLPAAQTAISHFDSVKTVTVNSIPVEVGTFIPLVSQPSNFYYSSLRVDHQLSSTDQISYRYLADFRTTENSGDNLSFGPRWGNNKVIHAQNHYISYTKTIGSSFVDEARVAYVRRRADFPEKDPISPTINLSSLFTVGGQAGFPQNRIEQGYQFQNVARYMIGRHAIKLGFDIHHENLLNDFDANSKGTWTFSSLENFMNNTGTLSQALTQAQSFKLKQLDQAYFLQDDIKVMKNLTVNLGMRYETSSVPFGMFGATDPAILAVGVPGPVKRDTNNWGPRVGFAYSPSSPAGVFQKLLGSGKSSIRGGFGVSYDILYYTLLANTALSYPRTGASTAASGTLVDVFPTLLPKTGTIAPLNALTSTFVNMPSDSKNPTTNYWSLSVQRQISNRYLLEVGYSGNRSYHGIRQSQANPGVTSDAKAAAVIAACSAPGAVLATCVNPPPFDTPVGTNPPGNNRSVDRLNPLWGSRQLLETTGKGRYDGGYVQFDRKFGRGLQLGANLTYSATFSDSEEPTNDSTILNGIATSSPQVPQDFRNYRSEWARSVFDRPLRLGFHYQYELPWFSSSPRLLKDVFSGWQVSGYSDFQSGQPFTIHIAVNGGVDTLGSGTAMGARPDVNPGGIILYDPSTHNLRSFTIPLNGTGIVTAPHFTNTTTGAITFLANSMPRGGNLPRNSFRGPGFQNWNLSIKKKFNLFSERTIEIRSDFINLFNHDNFLNPDAVMGSATFGQSNFTNGPGMATDARQVVLGAKFRF